MKKFILLSTALFALPFSMSLAEEQTGTNKSDATATTPSATVGTTSGRKEVNGEAKTAQISDATKKEVKDYYEKRKQLKAKCKQELETLENTLSIEAKTIMKTRKEKAKVEKEKFEKEGY
jgi:hypothetical protein